MDKIIEKKTGWRVAFTKKALPYWLGALLLAFIVYLIARPNNKTLRVDKDTVTVSSAVKGEFNDYIRISGRVQPMTTIQLSPQEGGIVEKILIEEGSPALTLEPSSMRMVCTMPPSCGLSWMVVIGCTRPLMRI